MSKKEESKSFNNYLKLYKLFLSQSYYVRLTSLILSEILIMFII